MSLNPRTPVLVGAGAISQRVDDPLESPEAIELMIAALEQAADDAGRRDILSRADSVWVPRGFWGYRDPGRLIADRFAADAARSIVSEIGILQTTLLGRACQAIVSGKAQVILIAGGEAKYRALRAKITGTSLDETSQAGDLSPDETLRPAAELWSELELANGLQMPVGQYAIIENALRHSEGLSLDAHRREVARLWASFSAVAAKNPRAWNRNIVSADEIREPSERNPMLAFPYTKLHNSQWNVDQAAGLILCSLETARAAGIRDDRFVFPLAVTESNFVVSRSEMTELERSHGFRVAGQRALARAGKSTDDLDHLELYSCFPAAVRVQAREMGIPYERKLTVTGGMAFAGGPLNNFVLQAAQRMRDVLREDTGSTGMLTAVSGYVSKQGVSLWSTRPPENPFEFEDVSDEVEKLTALVKVEADYEGPATVASYTVLHAGGPAARGVLICDIAKGRRAIVATADPDLMLALEDEEFCGRGLRIGALTNSRNRHLTVAG